MQPMAVRFLEGAAVTHPLWPYTLKLRLAGSANSSTIGRW